MRPKAMTIDRWERQAEKIEVAKNLLYYKQSAGLSFDKKRLALYEKESLSHSKTFLKLFGKEPRLLFLASADAFGRSKTFKLQSQAHAVRSTKIISSKYKLAGNKVNWGSWRQFTAKSDDSFARKELFDEFISKSRFLTPLIEARFKGYKESLAKCETDPLSLYLELEGLDYETMINFVDNLGKTLRPIFTSSVGEFSKEILEREPEYYDDYYFFRSRVFRKYAEHFPTKYEPVQKILTTMKGMGLDASKVKVDDKDRKAKSASAFCFSIKVPTDVRICYRKSNPLENFSGVFHEFGHGVHGVSINPKESFANRYVVAMGVAEIFSIFFENLLHDRIYLKEELGLDQVAEDIFSRFRFNELFFVAFYAANSTMKLKYWKDNLTMDQANNLYSSLTKKYMGIEYPGKYWQLHHVMPEYFLYSPSYLVAAVRAFELANYLRSRYGERYWKEKDAGKFVRSLLYVGQGIDVSTFSKLDWQAFTKHMSS
ncbi:MAG: M3 family metallopeptidase [Nitrososphaerales archaeon]